MAKKLLSIRIVFSALVTLAFAYGVYEALGYAYLAKIFPLYVSLVLLAVGLINLALEIRDKWKGVAEAKSGGTADLEVKWDMQMSQVLQKFGVFVAVIIVLYGGIWFIGYPLSITIFIIVLYRYVAGTKWHWALVAGAAGLGFLALVSKLLYMDWPEGLIKLPWPLG
ncbi:MAG: hypothetical protein AMJ54_03605 [Deltaproteobacteria bacterium SG8_13]|nr:MAG: hypothetical protein AMJ54_03605 [Deltaproteobacteria bacterium SG8_13]